jgi:hypothetical protein
MGTNTTRLGLYKPLDDGSEFVNVSTDLNQNHDKLAFRRQRKVRGAQSTGAR